MVIKTIQKENMKTLRYSIFVLLTLMVIMTGCKKQFANYQKDPNAVSQVPPSLVLRSILYDMYNAGNDRDYSPISQSERESQYSCRNYTYYGNNNYWSGSGSFDYTSLHNVQLMESEATRVAGSNSTPYHALGKFLRAWFYFDMTMKFGDIPLTQALQGVNNITPKYDTQKSVILTCLKWCDSANTQLAGFINNGFNEFSGDIYYTEGSTIHLDSRSALIEWQKVVNTFELRMLINLSKKTSDADLNVAGRFAAILGNPTQYPIMTGMGDNLEFQYNTSFDNYPSSPLNFGNDATRYNMAATYMSILSSTNDIRAMMVAEPARGLGFADTSYQSFVGAPTGLDLSSMAGLVASGKLSLFGRHRYYETLTAEPCFLLSYPEMCFNIAEGITRGWATGNAETWYKQGIQADLGFYGIVDGQNTVTFQKVGATSLGQDVTYTKYFTFAGFYAQPSIKLSSSSTTALNQILTQKYVAFFRNSGLQPYYQYRRTGVPTFDTSPGVGNSSRIPNRFQYPSNEQSVNSANWTAAITSQYGGTDDLFKPMWILQ